MKFGRFKPWNEWAEASEFHFGNGYGSIVIRGPQGLYELAMLRKRRKHWEITYKTPIASDVLGNLEVDDVVKYLEEISKLK